MADDNFYFDREKSSEEVADGEFEDIKSYSGKAKKKSKNHWQLSKQKDEPLYEYGTGIFKKLGGIVKAISFLVSFFFFAVTAVLSFLLYSIDKFFMPFALALLILGTLFSLIIMFLIYALGQVVSQNNEILRRLEKNGYHR